MFWPNQSAGTVSSTATLNSSRCQKHAASNLEAGLCVSITINTRGNGMALGQNFPTDIWIIKGREKRWLIFCLVSEAYVLWCCQFCFVWRRYPAISDWAPQAIPGPVHQHQLYKGSHLLLWLSHNPSHNWTLTPIIKVISKQTSSLLPDIWCCPPPPPSCFPAMYGLPPRRFIHMSMQTADISSKVATSSAIFPSREHTIRMLHMEIKKCRNNRNAIGNPPPPSSHPPPPFPANVDTDLWYGTYRTPFQLRDYI